MQELTQQRKYQKELDPDAYEVRPKGDYWVTYSNDVAHWMDFFYKMNMKNPEIQSNSSRSSITKEITSTQFKENIKKEYEFFDENYFAEKTSGMLNLYYSGVGKKGEMQFLDENLKYEDVVEHILICTNNFINQESAKKLKHFYMNFYIDASYSGSAKEAVEKWVEQKGGSVK